MLHFLPAAMASDVFAYLRRKLHEEKGQRVRAKMDRALDRIDDAEKPRPLETVVPSLPPSHRGTIQPDEIVKRGQEIYERRWRESLEQTARGRFVAINILTEEYVLGEPRDTEFGAGRAFRARWPDESVPCLVIAIGVPLAA
jgi:hypothetical protein